MAEYCRHRVVLTAEASTRELLVELRYGLVHAVEEGDVPEGHDALPGLPISEPAGPLAELLQQVIAPQGCHCHDSLYE